MNNLQSNNAVTKCFLFCGLPGSGKTTALFKTYSVLYKKYRNKVQIITLDSYNVKGRYECEKFCEIGQVDFKTIGSNANTTSSKPSSELLQELGVLLLKTDEKIIRLFDFSGVRYQQEWINAFIATASSLPKKIEIYINYCIPVFTNIDFIKTELKKLKENFTQHEINIYLSQCDVILLSDEYLSTIKKNLYDSATINLQYMTNARITRLFATSLHLYLGSNLHVLDEKVLCKRLEKEIMKNYLSYSTLINDEKNYFVVHYDDYLRENEFILHFQDKTITKTIETQDYEDIEQYSSKVLEEIIDASNELLQKFVNI